MLAHKLCAGSPQKCQLILNLFLICLISVLNNLSFYYILLYFCLHINCVQALLLKNSNSFSILMFHPPKVKVNENISFCNKKLPKFEEYGWASVAFWQVWKHEIALFCSGQTEPYATALALATVWPMHFLFCDKWQLKNSHWWEASGGWKALRIHKSGLLCRF